MKASSAPFSVAVIRSLLALTQVSAAVRAVASAAHSQNVLDAVPDTLRTARQVGNYPNR
jgi:hypothetical protein